MDLKNLQIFKEKAIEDCKKLSFTEKAIGLWSDEDVIKFFERTYPEDAIKNISGKLFNILDISDNNKILCVGGGTGGLGRSVISLSPRSHVTEIDLSKEMVVKANELAKTNRVEDNFISVVADVMKLPFKDGEFDLVIAYSVFRYLNQKEQEVALKEMIRVSKKSSIVAEVVLKELIVSLQNTFKDEESTMFEISTRMNRVSLFYMLLKGYRANMFFKDLVNEKVTSENDFIDVLSKLAGTIDGVIYGLEIKK